jgi:hypothetical protein
MNMNSQSAKQFQSIAVLGLVFLVVGLFVSLRYAVLCREDIDIYQLGDFAMVIAGVSIQLLGLGLIIWKK